MKKIGRVKYITKGQYDPTVTYTEMEVVLYEGSLWEPKKETTGNPPPDHQRNEDGTPAENEFWQLFLPGALGDDYVKKTDLSKAPTETTAGKPGINFPDGKTIQVDENGMLTGTPLDFMGTWKALQEGLASGEIIDGMIGYIKGTPDNPEDPDHPNNILIHIDDYLSLVSSNAVQNRIITAAINEIKALAEQNAQIIEETKALRASIETFGLSKICPVETTDVTETDNGLVLGAIEKNASIDGTFAKKISEISNILTQKNTGQFVIPGGLKICWGTVGYSGPLSVSFPFQFTNSPVVNLTSTYGATPDIIVPQVRIVSVTNSSFQMECYYKTKGAEWSRDTKNSGVHWIAIGY